MPMVDLPLEQLKRYKGSHPIPDDFDEFWDARVLEAGGVCLQYEIKENSIFGYDNCQFYDLYFKGVNGASRYAKLLKPKHEDCCPLILQFHGYPGASRSWFEQSSFVGMGFAVLAMDCPGQGGLGEDVTARLGTTVAGHLVSGLDDELSKMYYVELFQDTCVLVRIARCLGFVDDNRIYANGASQGAGIALACTALNPIIKRCGALYPFLSDYRRVWEMDLDLVAYEGLRYYFRWFDPMHERVDEVFTKLGYIDVSNFAHRIYAEVLFGTGLMDTICPPSTQFAIYNALAGVKRQVIFPEYSHEEIGEFDDLLIDFFLKEAN